MWGFEDFNCLHSHCEFWIKWLLWALYPERRAAMWASRWQGDPWPEILHMHHLCWVLEQFFHISSDLLPCQIKPLVTLPELLHSSTRYAWTVLKQITHATFSEEDSRSPVSFFLPLFWEVHFNPQLSAICNQANLLAFTKQRCFRAREVGLLGRLRVFLLLDERRLLMREDCSHVLWEGQIQKRKVGLRSLFANGLHGSAFWPRSVCCESSMALAVQPTSGIWAQTRKLYGFISICFLHHFFFVNCHFVNWAKHPGEFEDAGPAFLGGDFCQEWGGGRLGREWRASFGKVYHSSPQKLSLLRWFSSLHPWKTGRGRIRRVVLKERKVFQVQWESPPGLGNAGSTVLLVPDLKVN